MNSIFKTCRKFNKVIYNGINPKYLFVTIILVLASNLFAQDDFVYVQDGRLLYPNGEEVALMGVNLQTMISWEYNAKLKDAGIPKDAEVWKRMADKSLDELEIMGANYIRVHLTPSDFTDANGGLIETIYLDLLDYTTAEAAKRGIRLCYAFMNYMGGYEVASSFMRTSYLEAKSISSADEKYYHKALLMFDNDYLAASKNYIRNLLNRENPYSNKAYKSDTNIIVWGIQNEPTYLDYNQLKLYTEEYSRFQIWLTDNGLTENNGANYPSYRKQRVKGYINEIHDEIRSAGSVQPVEWSLNWHRFRNGREDVFTAVAESKVEVVSFCTYPGQSVATQLGGGSYLNFDGDLSTYDFSDWFKSGYNELSWYGWLLTNDFSSKAKIVYEFESFYNQSSYIYPAIADLQRSLGAQAAAMWHYSQPDYAQYNSGSHILNLKCTPNKAAAFAVASKIYQNTQTEQAYHPNSTTEWQTDNYMYSFSNDIAIYSDDESYCYSASVSPGQLPSPPINPKYIMGIGNSELVEYSGNGNYLIELVGDTLDLNIQPDVSYNYSLSSREDALITNLHYDTIHDLKLKFWEKYGKYEIFSVEEGKYELVSTAFYLDSLSVKPGKYKIFIADTLYSAESEAPTTPANLVVGNVKPTKVDLSWEASSNAYIEKYIVFVDGVEDIAVFAPATSVTIDGLTCGNSHNLSVKAVSGAGNESPLSAIETVTTDICDIIAPTKPTNLVSSNITPNSIKLSWQQSSDNIEVWEYEVYINGKKKLEVLYPDTSINISGLYCETDYELSVKAKDEAGNLSPASEILAVSTIACSGLISYQEWRGIEGWELSDLTSHPDYPENPDTTGYVTSLQIPTNYGYNYGQRFLGSIIAPETGTYYFWIASDNAGQLWLSPDNTYDNKLLIAYNNSWTNYQEWNKFSSQKSAGKNLIKDQKYYVEVIMKAAAGGDHLTVGWRKPSDGIGTEPFEIISGRVLGPYQDHRAPTIPVNLLASNITETSLDLNWDSSTDDSGLAGYYILQNDELIDTLLTTSISITGLTSGLSYDFAIKAFDIYGNVSKSSMVETVVTTDNEEPSAPGNLVATEITGNSCKLSWDSSTDNAAIEAYDIYENAVLKSSVTDTFSVITGLEMVVSYTFTVKARDAAGNSSNESSVVVLTPDTEAPSTPSNLTSSNITGNSCSLSWQASNDNIDVAEYEVFKDGELEKSVYFTYTDISELTNAISYTFTVRAKDVAGNVSEESNAIIVNTLDTEAPTTPVNLRASNISLSGVDLSWEASTDNLGVTAYEVFKNNEFETLVSNTNISITGLQVKTNYEFQVKALDAAGNISIASNSVSVFIDNTSASFLQASDNNILLYPNPAKDFAYIKNALEGIVSVLSVDGRIMLSKDYKRGDLIDLSSLTPGFYILRLSGNGMINLCFSIER